jgi:hypothetical protein
VETTINLVGMRTTTDFGGLRTRRLYGLVYPRNTLLVKMVVSLMNLLVWRGPAHAFVRSPEMIEGGRRRAVLRVLWSGRPGARVARAVSHKMVNRTGIIGE